MNGPEGAAQRLTSWLGATIGDRAWLDAFAARQGFADTEVPVPGVIAPYDPGPLALEQWPGVWVTVDDLVATTPPEARSDGSQQYRATYAVTVWALVRHEHYAAVATLRNRYALAIRHALLSRVQLAPPAAYGSQDYDDLGEDVQIARPSLRENYSPAFVDRQVGAVIAGSSTRVQVTVGETVPGPDALGVAAELTLEVERVPSGDTGGLRPVWTP